MLRERTLDLQKAIQMCTSSEIASQQMKTIQGGEDKQTEDLKKFSETKATDRSRRKKEENRLIQREKTGK